MKKNTTQRPSQIAALEKSVKEAVELSNKIWGIVKKDWFTTNELVNKSNTGHEQAKQILNHLGQYGLLITESKDGKFRHKIIFNNKDREELIQVQIDKLNKEIEFLKQRTEYLAELKKTRISFLIKV